MVQGSTVFAVILTISLITAGMYFLQRPFVLFISKKLIYQNRRAIIDDRMVQIVLEGEVA